MLELRGFNWTSLEIISSQRVSGGRSGEQDDFLLSALERRRTVCVHQFLLQPKSMTVVLRSDKNSGKNEMLFAYSETSKIKLFF